MNILNISDLHLEASKFTLSVPGNVDVLCLTGDIGIGLEGLKWAYMQNCQVLYVMGNHEFEGYDYDKLMDSAYEFAEKAGNIEIMQEKEVIIDNVRFLGCTLWTDFKLFGSHYKQDAKYAALRGMPEYATVIKNGKLLHTRDTLNIHNSNKDWLKFQLRNSFSGSTVILTHHAPSINSLANRYQRDLLSAAFVSNLDELIGFSDYWFHGHTHTPFDYVLHNTRFICNPRGFHRITNRAVNGFTLDKIITIPNLNYIPGP